MPMMMRDLLGLDPGSHTLKAVELKQNLRSLEPSRFLCEPAEVDESLRTEALRRFMAAHALPADHIVCAIPGNRVSGRRLEFPFSDRKRLRQAIPFEIEASVPFEIEDLVFDWQLIDSGSRRARVVASLAQRAAVSSLLADLASAGCRPRVLEAEGLVLGNLSEIFPLADHCMLVDMGHSKTTLCLLLGGQAVASRSIPIGGATLTHELAEDTGLDIDSAEQLKCEQGLFDADLSSRSPRALAVVDRIASEILRTLESFENTLAGDPFETLEEVVLMGGGARLHRVDEYLRNRIGTPTRRLSAAADGESGRFAAVGDPVLFGPAIALALRGSARAQTHMNFRQEEFAYRVDLRRLFGRELRPTALLAALATGLATISIFTSIGLEMRRADRLEARAAAIYASAFPGRSAPERPVAALSQAVGEARDRAEFLGLYAGNLSALELMSELSRRVPADLEVQFEEVDIDRQLIRIKVAARQYEAADRLENELGGRPPFIGTDVSGQIKKKKDGSLSFSISIPLQHAEGDT